MTELEEFINEIELKEAAENMHFSTYFIPKYYQPVEDINGN